MPSKINACLLCAVMLAALLLCAPGVSAEDAPTSSPEGDFSGEEGVVPSDRLSASQVWNWIIDLFKRHRDEFMAEFQNHVKYIILGQYKISSLPEGCLTNSSKEATLHRLAQGLLVYTALLKYVEKEVPSSQVPANARHFAGLLIDTTKQKMRNPEQVTALTSSQEETLRMDLENPDPFRRKMIAHSTLRELSMFLVDCKRALYKKEMVRGRLANRKGAPVTFFYQKS